MEEIKEKKEWSKLKIIGSLFVLILAGLFIFSGMSYLNYKNNQQEKSLEEVKQQIEVQTNQPIILKNVKIPDPNIKNPLTTVNPRSSFQNSSGHEIFFIAHDGSSGGIGNLTFTTSGSGYSFVNYLGDQITPILKGWFLSLNTTNITSTRWCNSTACFSTEQFTIDTDTDLWTQSGSNIYYNTGKVSIGTASAVYPLTINSSTRQIRLLNSLGTANGWAIGSISTGFVITDEQTLSDRFNIDNLGNVLIDDGNLTIKNKSKFCIDGDRCLISLYYNSSNDVSYFEKNINITGNLNASRFGSSSDQYCNATHCNTISDFLRDNDNAKYNSSLINLSEFEDQSSKLGMNYSWFKLSCIDFNSYLNPAITSNISNHESNYKHGNTTAEIEALDSFNTTQEIRTAINNSAINVSGSSVVHGNLNITNNGNLSVTTIYHPLNEKNCWGNNSHPCWVWSLGNATGFYAWGGG